MKPRNDLGTAGLASASLSIMLALVPGASLHAQATTVTSSASGWVGVSIIQHGEGDPAHGVAMDYPVVASVEPGSPAQAAGLAAGDTIVAYNDVNAGANPLGYRKLLVPGEHITFRIRRNGARSIELTVGKRSGRNAYRSGIVVNSAMVPPAAALAGFGPVAIAAPLNVNGDVPLAGAQLARLNAGLAAALNVKEGGMLVIDVADGSPAAAAGLEAGDVIMKADGTIVRGPSEIVRAMRDAKERTVSLDVVRRGKSETIALHW